MRGDWEGEPAGARTPGAPRSPCAPPGPAPPGPSAGGLLRAGLGRQGAEAPGARTALQRLLILGPAAAAAAGDRATAVTPGARSSLQPDERLK